MCSEIPNPKLPVSEKLPILSSYSFTFSPRSSKSIAFSPRTVTHAEIVSLRRMENSRTVYRARPKLGFCPVSDSSTRAWEGGVGGRVGGMSEAVVGAAAFLSPCHRAQRTAYVSRSPDCPVEMLSTSLSTFTSRIRLLAFFSDMTWG